MKKAIIIEVAKPQNKSHKVLLGETSYDNEEVFTVWIREGQEGKQLVDTYFHELTHVFLAFAKHRGKIDAKEEERLCRMVGQCAATILTKGASK